MTQVGINGSIGYKNEEKITRFGNMFHVHYQCNEQQSFAAVQQAAVGFLKKKKKNSNNKHKGRKKEEGVFGNFNT